jgi:recombination protein RecA
VFLRDWELKRRREILFSVSNAAQQQAVKGISTGSYGFDKALVIGGVPRGRIVEVYGPPSCGKTTLALHVAAAAQTVGGSAAFIDAEHALDLQYAKNLGVRVEELIVAKPENGEKALAVALSLVDTGLVELVIIDSVAALVPERELSAEVGEDHFGDMEQMMAKGLRKLELSAFRTGACILFVNQIRCRFYETTGDCETTTGGRPLRFYAALRMDLSVEAPIVESGNTIGNRVRMRVIKNRAGGAFRSAVTPLIIGEGFSRELELLDIACRHAVVEAGHKGFSYQGQPITRMELRKSPSLAARLMEEVRVSARALQLKPVGKVGPGVVASHRMA